jgi:hypothetical protein
MVLLCPQLGIQQTQLKLSQLVLKLLIVVGYLRQVNIVWIIFQPLLGVPLSVEMALLKAVNNVTVGKVNIILIIVVIVILVD